ncbi:MAG: pyridoxamine 5-phosphate oxidase [Anaerolinea sp.]|nr:pyridoxamine 5-phosphate oxidase [Anaerolinea sp.]
MTAWRDFEREAPELARLARERFDSTDLVMLGTLRKDGWPRITPVEFTYFEGDFVIGGMWQSKKMLDLLRDPRCVVHSTTSNKDGQQGDVKLYGNALPMAEARVEPYWQHIYAKLHWRPTGPAHVFVVDIKSAGYVVFDATGTMRMLTWPGPGDWVVKHGEDASPES